MTRLGTRREIGIVALAVVAMTAVSLAAIGFAGAARHRSSVPGWSAATCATPALEGAVVDMTLSNMGGPMTGGGGSPMGGMMRLRADQATVSRGTVSFVAVNIGSVNHELVVLPLPDGQIAGTRPIGGDGRIDEAGSLGEASNNCGSGAGEGIAPSRSSWVTLTLAPGRYELVCNLPGHYAAGMYTQFTVD